ASRLSMRQPAPRAPRGLWRCTPRDGAQAREKCPATRSRARTEATIRRSASGPQRARRFFSMTETTGSEHTPDHAQAQTPPDNQAKPTGAEAHPSTAAGEAEVVVAPAVPTPVDPAELPAISREVPATRLLDQPTPAPDDDGDDVSGSADPASVARAAKRIVSGVPEALAEELATPIEPAVEAEPEPEPEPVPVPVPTSWDELDLPPSLRSAIDALGWTQPTPVQARTFATMVAGTDVLVQSQTG